MDTPLEERLKAAEQRLLDTATKLAKRCKVSPQCREVMRKIVDSHRNGEGLSDTQAVRRVSIEMNLTLEQEEDLKREIERKKNGTSGL